MGCLISSSDGIIAPEIWIYILIYFTLIGTNFIIYVSAI